MDRECNIVRDLMVLYELENCSEESIQMIQEHVEKCEECKKIWVSKTGEVLEKAVDEVRQEEGTEEFDKLRKRIRRRNILKIIVIAMIISFIGHRGYRFVKDPVVCEIDDMEFTNFYKDSGEIGFKVTLTDGKGFGEHAGFYSGSSALSEHAVQIEVYRSRFPKETAHEKEISMYVSVPDIDGNVTEIYYGEGDGEVLIWQEGDPISELTEEIQKDMERLYPEINER